MLNFCILHEVSPFQIVTISITQIFISQKALTGEEDIYSLLIVEIENNFEVNECSEGQTCFWIVIV